MPSNRRESFSIYSSLSLSNILGLCQQTLQFNFLQARGENQDPGEESQWPGIRELHGTELGKLPTGMSLVSLNGFNGFNGFLEPYFEVTQCEKLLVYLVSSDDRHDPELQCCSFYDTFLLS